MPTIRPWDCAVNQDHIAGLVDPHDFQVANGDPLVSPATSHPLSPVRRTRRTVPPPATGAIRGRFSPKPHLEGARAIPPGRPHLKNKAGALLDHGDRDRAPILPIDLRHSDFPTQKSDSHDIYPC